VGECGSERVRELRMVLVRSRFGRGGSGGSGRRRRGRGYTVLAAVVAAAGVVEVAPKK
jgi:hypothetical protein